MGKAGKSRRHDAKMRAKRAKKNLRRAEYASMKGTSKKRKKQKTSPKFSTAKHRHLTPHCGNVGCARCYPEFARKPHNIAA